MRILVLFVLLSGVAAAAPSRVEERQLLCTRIDFATSGSETKARVDVAAPEGGGAELHTRDDFTRVSGEALGESQRARFEYFFVKDDLVCARETTTSIWTVLEASSKNPDGAPPFVRTDFRVFAADGNVAFASVYQVPKDAGEATKPDVVQRNARDLLARLRSESKSQGLAKGPLAKFTFGYTYPRSDPKHTARPSSCAAITAEQRKAITGCKSDGTLKRCRLDATTSINIFTSEPDCKSSRHDVTEGD